MPPRCGRLEPMSRSAPPPPPRSDIGVQVGLVVAAAQVPGTFAPGLTPRSDVDQGLTTALSTGLHYLLALGTQDALQAAAAELARTPVAGRWSDPATRQRALVLAADLLPCRSASRCGRPCPTVRARRWRAARPGRPDGARPPRAWPRCRWRPRGRAAPPRRPAGCRGRWRGCRSPCRWAGDRVRRGPPPRVPPDAAARTPTPPLARSAARGRGGGGQPRRRGLRRAPTGRRPPAGGWRRCCPAGRRSGAWRRTRHPWASLAAGTSLVWSRAMRSIETGAAAEEPVLGGDESTRWTRADPERFAREPGAVGHARQGGTPPHAHPTCARPRRPTGRPGLPDLSIETVMGEPAVATPVQVFVGLDSAPTAAERVELALAEMERTGAFDRSLLVLVSPTGLGYVNYVAMAAAQYLTRGDVASVTVQYSKRPSPLSLGSGRRGARAEPAAVAADLRAAARSAGPAPAGRPVRREPGRAHQPGRVPPLGHAGLEALGIDRALWIGTPYGSGWMHEVTGPDRVDVDRRQRRRRERPRAAARRARGARSLPPYVMLSHDNDGVTTLRRRPARRPRPRGSARAGPRWSRARRGRARAASRRTCAGAR